MFGWKDIEVRLEEGVKVLIVDQLPCANVL